MVMGSGVQVVPITTYFQDAAASVGLTSSSARLELLLQRPVDLVRLRERMNPDLRQAILSEGIST